MTGRIERIYIEESVVHHPLAMAALDAQREAQGDLPTPEIIEEKQRVPADKRTLILRKSRGEIFHNCPGTQGAVCCNYTVLDFLSGCPFNCSYCYLNAYLNEGGLHLQVDLENPVGRLVEQFRAQPNHLFRVGTGEIADSLALPASEPMNRYLVETFSNEPNAQLELKTKSARVDALLDLEPRGRVVVSWSLSPEALSLQEEHGTAPTSQRLAAARRVVDSGYQIAFHLDPLLYAHASFEQWQRDYSELLDELFAAVPVSQIVWISVGGLRLMKGLREHMLANFPESRLAAAEMVPGVDGKLRYPKSLRKRMFAWVKTEIDRRMGRHAPPVYLCMESREVWQGALGGTPDPQSNLRPLFNRAAPRPVAL